METNKIIELDGEYLFHTYGRVAIVPESGRSATLTDADGKKYIDFTSGIGVNSLGYSDEGWVKAVSDQAAKIQHFSNYYYCQGASVLAERLVKLSGLSKVFFGNSGAEANEGAIKLARKYSFDKYGKGRTTIISLTKSFHGRTITTLSATGQEKFHNFFFPFTEGFKFVPINDIEAARSAMTDDVCAVIAEPIQGEGGVNELDGDYVNKLRELCDSKDVLLIFDEVQTGVGRCGSFFSYEQFGVKPDIVTLAKGLGGGLPIGVFIGGEKVADTLSPGQHGTTFGSNPIACAGANEVVSRVTSSGFLEEVRKKGDYIRARLTEKRLSKLVKLKGKGMMIGIQVNCDPHDILNEAVKAGLLVLTAGEDVVRLLPPLTITKDELDRGLDILVSLLA